MYEKNSIFICMQRPFVTCEPLILVPYFEKSIYLIKRKENFQIDFIRLKFNNYV